MDLRQPPQQYVDIPLMATPPIVCGLLGLFIWRTKGMFLGIIIGLLMTALWMPVL